MKSALKSCDIDLIPINILKASRVILIKPITAIIDLSLESGTFPLSFEEVRDHTSIESSYHLILKSKIPIQNSCQKNNKQNLN